ncbi:TonB-dependent receptor [Aureispira anguillae]|uniref:Carboxypeptidase-like regulatory domain-containing protein n=1 Tax=Aureispira anguillae TaxID=2864201 RepID=A0A916DSQ1_9BACT|nr:TonB-dependent receptor [Aureispira anguillae]BDS11217.1 carboxypeptidase-like regulatory domain-containing protein [Aureispira anguillae]
MKLFSTFCVLLFLLCGLTWDSNAQTVEGQVVDESNEGLAYANVSISGEGFSLVAITDENGYYKLEQLPQGNLQLVVQYLGYQSVKKELTITTDKTIQLDIALAVAATVLKELEVVGQSKEEELKTSAYAVDVIATQSYKNLNIDLNQLINKTAGIHIRSVGGMGSAFNLSLNGLSGNRIRYFVDGVPMENLGTALSLNNYPVNLVKSIEIFKGVVPIDLSADALGGAINIVSDYKGKSFLDLSYSYGSFNTHQAAFNGQYSRPDKGYFITLNAFFNHSDNNYWMNDIPLYDELGNKVDEIDIQRFHDEYTSGMFKLKLGLLGKPFADELSLAFTGALNRNNYQNPDNNIKLSFGELHSKNKTFLLQLLYKKTFKKVALKVYSQWSTVTETVVDTSNKKYNWAGAYWFRDQSSARGELNERRSLFVLNDKLVNSSIQLSYKVHPRHQLDWTISQNFLYRKGKDEVDALRRSFLSPNYIHKNLLGSAYRLNTSDKRLEATAFVKGYWFNANLVTQDYDNKDVHTSVNSFFVGYGALATYHFPKIIQLKLSYERAYRIPESYEILGDGIYIRPNPNLSPEASHNINFGIYTSQIIRQFGLSYSLNGFYRNAEDYIRFVPIGPFGSYENINRVGVLGAETNLGVKYKKMLSLDANLTYQHLTDETQFDEGLLNTNYKSRLPNIPYLFANFRLGYHADLSLKKIHLTFYWSGRYVHQFYLTWEKLGNVSTKNSIPTQFIQDLSIECALQNGRYNIAATLNNFTNVRAYDNFNIQKPGIAFSLKLRCFLLK